MKSKKYLLIIFLYMFIPLSLAFSAYPETVSYSHIIAESTLEKDILWEIGEETLSCGTFDTCPGHEAMEYGIAGDEAIDYSDFPCGISMVNSCFPPEILLKFFPAQGYANVLFSMSVFGVGKLGIYFDAVPVIETNIDTGFGWEGVNIPIPYIFSEEHIISLEIKDEKGSVWFDYLKLTGNMDSDQDGICDQSEGDMDRDNDGLPDDKDADTTTIPIPDQDGLISIIVQPKEVHDIPVSPIFREVYFTKAQPYHDQNQSFEAPPDIIFIDGLVSAKIINLGNIREVNLLLSPSISTQPLYGVEEVWARGTTPENWLRLTAVIDTNSNQISITLDDGGPEDLDNNVDGQISFSLGLGVSTHLTPYSQESCFIGSIEKNETGY